MDYNYCKTMASGFRRADGTYADNAWELNIKVTDLPLKNEQVGLGLVNLFDHNDCIVCKHTT